MPDAPVGETFEERKARIAVLRRMNSVLPKEKRHPIPPLGDPSVTQMVSTSETDPVEELLSMPRRSYFQYVCENLSADKDPLWDLFLNPRLIQLTYQALIRKHALVVRVKSNPETDVGRRRRNFLDMVENRMQQTQDALPASVLASGEDTTRRLFSAVQAHRRALTTNKVTPEPWDLALWQAVDDLVTDEEAAN